MANAVPIYGLSDLTIDQIFILGERELLITGSVVGKGIVLYYGVIELDGALAISEIDSPSIEGELSGVYAATRELLIISAGDCEQGNCTMYSVENYLSNETPNVLAMEYFSKPSIQTRTGMMAFWRKINGIDSLNLIDLKKQGREQYLGLFGNVFLDQAWSAGDNLIAAIKMERSDYYGRATEILHYVVDGNTNILKEYSSVIGLNPRII